MKKGLVKLPDFTLVPSSKSHCSFCNLLLTAVQVARCEVVNEMYLVVSIILKTIWTNMQKTAAGCWLLSLDSCDVEKEVPKLQYETSETMTQFPQKGCINFNNLFCCLKNQKLNFGCEVKQAPWKSYPACTFDGNITVPVLMASTIGWPRCSIVL